MVASLLIIDVVISIDATEIIIIFLVSIIVSFEFISKVECQMWLVVNSLHSAI
jgi:hypothetical protein